MGSKDEILSECDCGIIPLNPKHLFGWHKPANKLISFWFTGLPTIVSDTPAYKELMNEAGNDLYCSTIEDWVKKINLIKNMTPSQRENISKRDRMFVQKNYSDEALDNVWEEIFRYSILQHKK
jgi:glycosyltransferase involved in cell wall biosynthesis